MPALFCKRPSSISPKTAPGITSVAFTSPWRTCDRRFSLMAFPDESSLLPPILPIGQALMALIWEGDVMDRVRILFILLGWSLLAAFAALRADDSLQGFTSLFNGKDLSGWKVPEGDNGHW